jgi:hypothetical protein
MLINDNKSPSLAVAKTVADLEGAFRMLAFRAFTIAATALEGC